MEITDLLNLKTGTVLQKGTRKRIFLGFDGLYVFYKTPSGRGTSGEIAFNFAKWLKNAEIVTE